MPKRNSESAPMKRDEDVITKEKKTLLTSKTTGSEIDEIFAVKKRKKPENKTTKRSKEDKDKQSMKPNKKKEKQSEDGGQVDLPRKPRKRTGDGLAIYTEDELGINKAEAGGTPLCPFDCSCCF